MMGAATRYAYSNARVQVMKSKLLGNRTMQSMANAKDASSMLSILFQTEYRKSITEFGGMEIKPDLVDFALSKDLAMSVGRLVRLTPYRNRGITRALVSKWDLSNVKLALEAKDRGMGYESIARYVIDYGRYNGSAIKEALKEESVERVFSRLMVNSPYAGILGRALEVYRKTKGVSDAIENIDMGYYTSIGSVIRELQLESPISARIVRMDIDRRNILTLIRAKRLDMKFADIAAKIIPGGSLQEREMEHMYNSSPSVEALAEHVRGFNLRESVELYKKNRKLLVFEIGMYNAILAKSVKSLGHKVLSFATILAYIYMKDVEIYTIRILLKSRAYGLGKEDVERLMPWKTT